MQFRTDGNVTQMVLDKSGNLGIGTINPDLYKLKVSHGSFGLNPEDNFSKDDWEIVTSGNLQLYFNEVSEDNLIIQPAHIRVFLMNV